jgi:type IV secretory pathway VirB4 component
MKIPRHEATTAQLGATYPFVASSPLMTERVLIGRDLYGSVFSYDPFDLYRSGELTNPNMVVLGQVGRGKSALVKSYLYRQFAHGRRVIVIDPKGEYGAFATKVGGAVLRLAPGQRTTFNPLSLLESPDGDRNLALLQLILEGVTSASLGRELGVDEVVALQLALSALADSGRPISLRRVAEQLVELSGVDARSLQLSNGELREIGRMPALALHRLLGGEFSSMFDDKIGDLSGPSPLALSSKVLVIDVSAFYRSDALSVLLVALFGRLQNLVQHSEEQTICVIDEAWAVLTNSYASAFVQSFFKLARSFGVANILVAHRPSDLVADSPLISGRVQGLVGDCETAVCFGLTASESTLAGSLFGFNERQSDLLRQLGRGTAMWRVGDRSFLIQHRLGREERSFVDTDARMLLS